MVYINWGGAAGSGPASPFCVDALYKLPGICVGPVRMHGLQPSAHALARFLSRHSLLLQLQSPAANMLYQFLFTRHQ